MPERKSVMRTRSRNRSREVANPERKGEEDDEYLLFPPPLPSPKKRKKEPILLSLEVFPQEYRSDKNIQVFGGFRTRQENMMIDFMNKIYEFRKKISTFPLNDKLLNQFNIRSLSSFQDFI